MWIDKGQSDVDHRGVMRYFQHMTKGEVWEQESILHRAEEALASASAM